MRVACILASRSSAGIDGGGERHCKIDIAKVESGLLRAFGMFANSGGVGGVQRRARGHERDQVADMDHAGRIIERVLVNDEPRMCSALEYLDQFAEHDVLLHGDDVGARDHDAFYPGLAQTEDILEHGGFARRKTRLLLLGGEDKFKVRARRGRLPCLLYTSDAAD